MLFEAILRRIVAITNKFGMAQQDTLLALNEELGEYCRAIRQERFGHKKDCNELAKIEAIDIMMVAFEAYLEAGGTLEELPEIAHGKLDKWEKKLEARFPVKWNPFNKVVQDHRDGSVYQRLTDIERQKRGLPIPWTPEIGELEVHQSPIY